MKGEYFNPIDIHLTQQAYSIEWLRKKYKAGEIVKSSEWPLNSKSSSIIESLLIGLLPMPILLDWRNDKRVNVAVGGERLFSIFGYIDGEFCLEHLDYLEVINGKFYAEMKPYSQRRITETEIACYIIEPGTPDDVTKNIIRRYKNG